MGDVRMVIEAACGHGCNRTAKEGEEVRGCGQETCPDCLFARFVSELKRHGITPYVATLTHWPAAMHEHAWPEGKRDDDVRCLRCGATVGEYVKAVQAAQENGGVGEFPAYCRNYDPAREVVDDYTERGVKYPSGSFFRALGRRVKGSF